MHPSRAPILWASVLVAVLVTFLVSPSPRPLVGQVEGDPVGPSLSLTDAIDLAVWHRCLSQATLKAAVENELENHRIGHLGFRMISEHQDGDRSYEGAVAFPVSASVVTVLRPEYEYDHTSGSTPTLPPDSMTFTTASVTATLEDIAIADLTCWRFLLHVIDPLETPDTLLDALDGCVLRKAWCEKRTVSGDEWVYLYLKYYGPTSTKTITVSAEHEGDLVFGTLQVN